MRSRKQSRGLGEAAPELLLSMSLHRHAAPRDRGLWTAMVWMAGLALASMFIFLKSPEIGIERQSWGLALNGGDAGGAERHWPVEALCSVCFLILGRGMPAYHAAAFVLL